MKNRSKKHRTSLIKLTNNLKKVSARCKAGGRRKVGEFADEKNRKTDNMVLLRDAVSIFVFGCVVCTNGWVAEDRRGRR